MMLLVPWDISFAKIGGLLNCQRHLMDGLSEDLEHRRRVDLTSACCHRQACIARNCCILIDPSPKHAETKGQASL